MTRNEDPRPTSPQITEEPFSFLTQRSGLLQTPAGTTEEPSLTTPTPRAFPTTTIAPYRVLSPIDPAIGFNQDERNSVHDLHNDSQTRQHQCNNLANIIGSPNTSFRINSNPNQDLLQRIQDLEDQNRDLERVILQSNKGKGPANPRSDYTNQYSRLRQGNQGNHGNDPSDQDDDPSDHGNDPSDHGNDLSDHGNDPSDHSDNRADTPANRNERGNRNHHDDDVPTFSQVKVPPPPRFDPRDKHVQVQMWIFKMELWFDAARTIDDQKVRLAALQLDGFALTWWMAKTRDRTAPRYWMDFRQQII